jgi:hypothetical protein
MSTELELLYLCKIAEVGPAKKTCVMKLTNPNDNTTIQEQLEIVHNKLLKQSQIFKTSTGLYSISYATRVYLNTKFKKGLNNARLFHLKKVYQND